LFTFYSPIKYIDDSVLIRGILINRDRLDTTEMHLSG